MNLGQINEISAYCLFLRSNKDYRITGELQTNVLYSNDTYKCYAVTQAKYFKSKKGASWLVYCYMCYYIWKFQLNILLTVATEMSAKPFK